MRNKIINPNRDKTMADIGLDLPEGATSKVCEFRRQHLGHITNMYPLLALAALGADRQDHDSSLVRVFGIKNTERRKKENSPK